MPEAIALPAEPPALPAAIRVYPEISWLSLCAPILSTNMTSISCPAFSSSWGFCQSKSFLQLCRHCNRLLKTRGESKRVRSLMSEFPFFYSNLSFSFLPILPIVTAHLCQATIGSVIFYWLDEFASANLSCYLPYHYMRYSWYRRTFLRTVLSPSNSC